MRDIATTTLSGTLARDVDLRTLPSGIELARLRIATTTRRRTGDGWTDKTNLFTIEVSGAQARTCAQHLATGSRVVIDAEPDWREWTDQRGSKREAVIFRARQVLFQSRRSDPPPAPTANVQQPPAAPTPPRAPAPASAPAPAAVAGNGRPANVDELPF
jgi:single-strand DNA-binding protein